MLFLTRNSSGGMVAVSRMDESIAEMTCLYRGDVTEFDGMCERAKREKLAVRILLQELCGVTALCYDGSGKPYLSDNSQHISISHTKNFVAVFLHPSYPVGIDIEYRSSRASRLKERFLAADEMCSKSADCESYSELCWCAKEAAYKMLSDKSVDMFQELKVKPFDVSCEGCFCVEYTRRKQHFEMQYIQNELFTLVWSAQE